MNHSSKVSVSKLAPITTWKDAFHDNPWWLSARMFVHNPLGMAGFIGLILIILSAVLAPWLAPYPPQEMKYDQALAAPSIEHLLGTDDLGRDILSRVLYGGQESLKVGIIGVAIALLGGIFFGVISGYYGGWIDNLIMRVVDILLAFPYILLLLSIVAALGPGLGTVMIALGFAGIPFYTRLLRGSVLSAKNQEYVVSARVIGVPAFSIMFRHILVNIIAPVIVYATLDLGGAIMATAGLSYIGLGAQPPSPEWGAMLNAGRKFIFQAWWMSVFPGMMLFLSILFVNLIGDGLRDALDPKLHR